MSRIEWYDFNVMVWAEDGHYNWGICQEFVNARGKTSLEWLANGVADSLKDAADAVSDFIQEHFNET
jgi:hypothetical protein